MASRFLTEGPITLETVQRELSSWLEEYEKPLNKVLLVPPDGTRAHSMAGPITNMLYHMLQPAEVKILPALGTHTPMTLEEKQRIFGADVPAEVYLDHNWRTDVKTVGVVPGSYIKEISGGQLDYQVTVEVNREITDGNYDLILSIGQVVPHEVVGMANYTKNIVVGCGGKDIIDKSHFLGAVYGMERMMGRDYSPVRQMFVYAEENFLRNLPLYYILTVTETREQVTTLQGLFVGKEREVFSQAVAKSQACNLDLLEEPFKKVIVYLEPREFRSTWLGNKSVYRTRMAMADDGELIIVAPGVHSFGEDPEIDRLIRAFGYKTTPEILQAVETTAELAENLSVAAHLIHGSSENRFKITYAVQHLSEEEIRGVNYNYLPLAEAMQRYKIEELKEGFNTIDGEEIFYISNPALGLWALERDFS